MNDQAEYKGTLSDAHEPYLPSDQLKTAVRVARKLGRPLLLKGEPGCGKTRLAKAIARELYPSERLEDVYFEWPVKSTSRAHDGLYTFDAIARMSESQLAVLRGEDLPKVERFVSLGPLGKAYKSGRFAIVLIDEIDKADVDFPNDLLMELDMAEIPIPELGDAKIKADPRPLVIITSNDERDLPDAFLRRCVFHYLEFPDEKQLKAIVEAHNRYAGWSATPALIDAAIARLRQLRRDMDAKKVPGSKRVGTSELLDWIHVLAGEPDPLKQLRDGAPLPFAGVLLKSWEDHVRFVAGEPKT